MTSLVVHELRVLVLGAIGLVVHSVGVAHAAKGVRVAATVTLILLLMCKTQSVRQYNYTYKNVSKPPRCKCTQQGHISRWKCTQKGHAQIHTFVRVKTERCT